MFDLTAPIIPNESAAGIRIGQPVAQVVAIANPTSITAFENGEKLHFENVTVWVKNGCVSQIGVSAGYQGTLKGIIGIGSTIRDVQTAFGQIIEDADDNLITPDFPGWCFETEEWQHGQDLESNLDARLLEIFVFSDKKQ